MLKIGSRNSKLALIQAQMVITEIKLHFPNLVCEIIPIITTGDKILDKNLYDIGGKALFLKELEEALLEGAIDIAIHSLKDVPGLLDENFTLAAVLARDNPVDVLVSHKAKTIEQLPKNAKVGTCSPRRKIILSHIRSDLEIVTFRGNVDSRVAKVFRGEVDATILAYAGLKRLNLFDDSFCSIIRHDEMIPAPGQGVIAIETLAGNEFAANIAKTINHSDTWNSIQVERAFIGYLDANCRTPLAAHAYYHDGQIYADFMLSDIDGTKVCYHEETGGYGEARDIGIRAAKILYNKLYS